MRTGSAIGFACVVVACVSAPAQTSSERKTPAAIDSTTVASQGMDAPAASSDKPTARGASDQPAKFQTPQDLLTALEGAGGTISTLRANVIYERVDAVSENRERRIGHIVLSQHPGEAKTRKLTLMFDQHIDSAGHATSQRQRFVFDGGWLYEFDDQRHQLIARELVPPGENLDPLRIGEGPIPLPVGQKKEEVCRRFEVALCGDPSDPLLQRLDNIQGLALRPKPNTGVDPDLGELRVWYDRASLAPVAVKAMTKGGDTKILLLSKIELNAPLDESAKALLSTQPPAVADKGVAWRTDVRPFKADPR